MPIEEISTITVYGETNRAVDFAPTPELLEVLDLAALISFESKEQFNYTFGSLLIGFANGTHRINNWFNKYIEANRIKLSAILAYQHFPETSGAVRELAARKQSPEKLYLNQRRTATASSMNWLEEAKKRSEGQKHRQLGLRHLMGAIIFAPEFHRKELKSWGFKRPHWAKAYLEFVSAELPGDVSYWSTINNEVFPNGIDPTDTEETVGGGDGGQQPRMLFDPSVSLSEDLPSIANDRIDGEAYIDIKADVASLARVMCMRQVQPPLSIALFGQWGSGKSFFMAQLRNKVEELKKMAESGGEGKVFYEDIIQIDFNAWHYVEANLWASLVNHIFETLKVASEKPEEWKEKVGLLMEQMGAAKQSKQIAQENLEAAKAKAGEAQRTLIIRQNDAQIKVQALQSISRAEIARQTKLDVAVKANLDEAVETLGLAQARQAGDDVVRTLQEAEKFATETAAFVRAFWRAPGFGKRVCFVAGAVLVPVVIPLLLNLISYIAKSPEWGVFQKTIASLVVMVPTFLTPLIRTKKTAETVVASIRKASDDFDRAVAAKEAEERKRIQASVNVADGELKQAQKALNDAEEAVEKARKALEEALPAHALMAFIEERSASGDYRKSLGTLALVRQDFDKLSVLMRNARQANEETLKLGNGITQEYIDMLKKLPSIDRIILYIDDLDRCPPRQVVQVLQAIQLLLAFDLFVVVVGVDPRWISRSLTKHYPELLSDAEESSVARPAANGSKTVGDSQKDADVNGAARPLDYLEKIFQIPFWIKPLGNREAGGLIKGLLSPADRGASGDKQEEPSNKAQGGGSVQKTTNLNEGGKSTGGSAEGDSKGYSDPNETKTKQEESTAKQVEQEPRFASVKLTKEEEEFLSRFERLAGATPRAIKRFVNVYRLLRARVSKERESEFVGKANEPREFEAVMHLLAMFNSVPKLAQRFCMELEGNEQPATGRSLKEVVEKLEAAGELSEAERETLASMRTYAGAFETRAPSTDAYHWWFPVVARYSFVGQFQGISTKLWNEKSGDGQQRTAGPAKDSDESREFFG